MKYNNTILTKYNIKGLCWSTNRSVLLINQCMFKINFSTKIINFIASIKLFEKLIDFFQQTKMTVKNAILPIYLFFSSNLSRTYTYNIYIYTTYTYVDFFLYLILPLKKEYVIGLYILIILAKAIGIIFISNVLMFICFKFFVIDWYTMWMFHF